MIKIIGVGNPLLGDDGFGLKVVEKLEEEEIKDVEIIKLPTPSPWHLYEVFQEGDYFIIIDALADGKENEIEVFPLSELKSYPTMLKSQHEVSIAQVIDLLSLYDKKVDGIVVGTKVERVSVSLDLSKKLENMIPKAVEIVKEILSKIG